MTRIAGVRFFVVSATIWRPPLYGTEIPERRRFLLKIVSGGTSLITTSSPPELLCGPTRVVNVKYVKIWGCAIPGVGVLRIVVLIAIKWQRMRSRKSEEGYVLQ